jgi:pyruvate,water dikinase
VATTRIHTGDRIRINGTTGEVEILAAAPSTAPVGMQD